MTHVIRPDGPICNLTQHKASASQLAEGVVDLTGSDAARLRRLLTFETTPTAMEVSRRANEIVGLVPMATRVAMIGGAPYLMPALALALRRTQIMTLFAFSVRRVVDGPDGVKTSRFVHAGWVPAFNGLQLSQLGDDV